MWLKKEINQLCIKEFGLRHQLDIIQDNAYISFNLRRLVSLQLLSEESVEGGWQQVSQKSNSYWFNFVEFLKKFPDTYNILVQNDFVDFAPIVLTELNFKSIIQIRIDSCKRLLEIFRTIAYKGFLRESFARIRENRLIFGTFRSRSIISDPPGNILLRLDNRISFIRSWFDKLVARNQANYPSNIWFPVPISPKVTLSKTALHSIPKTPNHGRNLIPTVSDSKSNINFVRIKKRPIRLSEIVLSQDSSSTSSSDSIWDSPFTKRTKRS